MGGVIVEEDQKQKLDIFISIVYGRMWLFKPYTYAHGIFVIQIWYQISMILWICLQITIIRLLIRFQKTSKLKMNGRREKL